MHVILMHNPSAGSEDHRAEDITREIKRAGHQIAAVVTSRKELTEALREPADLVALAGGDGTFGKGASVLAGTGVPFTVLALGTANNVARTLRLDGPFDAQIDAWERSTVTDLDAAWMTAGADTTRFYEAAGFGAFPRLMHREKDSTRSGDPQLKLAQDLQAFRRHVADAGLKRYEVVADGEDLSGEYMLVEVMNVPFLGPQVELAPEASPHDGALDLVLAAEPERKELLRVLDLLSEGKIPSVSLPSRRVSRVEISTSPRRFHRDGELGAARIDHLGVRVDRGALKALVPARR